jgi:hypothetical protein
LDPIRDFPWEVSGRNGNFRISIHTEEKVLYGFKGYPYEIGIEEEEKTEAPFWIEKEIFPPLDKKMGQILQDETYRTSGMMEGNPKRGKENGNEGNPEEKKPKISRRTQIPNEPTPTRKGSF